MQHADERLGQCADAHANRVGSAGSTSPERTRVAASTGPWTSMNAARLTAGGSATRMRYARACRTASGTSREVLVADAVGGAVSGMTTP